MLRNVAEAALLMRICTPGRTQNNCLRINNVSRGLVGVERGGNGMGMHRGVHRGHGRGRGRRRVYADCAMRIRPQHARRIDLPGRNWPLLEHPFSQYSLDTVRRRITEL